jgi:hypothetical protein
MTKFEVTDAMVEDAVKQYVALMPFKVDPPTYKAMRAAITAAIEASGLVEENTKLKLFVEAVASGEFKNMVHPMNSAKDVLQHKAEQLLKNTTND